MNELLEYYKTTDPEDISTSVWAGKYRHGEEKTPKDMHLRLALNFAKARFKKDKSKTEADWVSHFLEFFQDFKYISPQGSVMANLGTDVVGSLSNCFVVGQPVDSYGGIMAKDHDLVQLMKRRGGVGIDISTLRPSGVATSNSAKSSTGAASFMHRYSNSTREVAQNGRRGALMISMDVRHPDIFEFVNMKSDRTKVTGANVSVMLRNDFMRAVEADEDYILRFPCDMDSLPMTDRQPEWSEYNELCSWEVEGSIFYTKRIKAKELYDQICLMAWENAEPGQMFVDQHWDYSPDGVYEQYRGITSNPCGEIFMSPYDACRLILGILCNLVENAFSPEAKVNWDKVYEVFYEMQLLADDLVDLELEYIDRIIEKIKKDYRPEDQQEFDLWEKVYHMCKLGRRTGNGITGLADMLAAMNFAYDSDEAVTFTEKLMYTKMKAELNASIDLAKKYGPFKGYDWNKEFKVIPAMGGSAGRVTGRNSFFEMLTLDFPDEVLRMKEYGRRNVSWSTVAPAGSTSIISKFLSYGNVSGGCEPHFSMYYMRRKKVNPNDKGVRVDFTDQNGDTWQEYPVVMAGLKVFWDRYRSLKNLNRYFFPNAVVIDKNEEVEGMRKDQLDALIYASPYFNSMASDIDYKQRVRIQAAIQKYTTHSISSTINLPNDVTVEEVQDIYINSWKAGLKGVTVYRDGSRTGVLIKEDNNFSQKDATKRPKEIDCDLYHVTSDGRRWTVLVGLLEGKPYEVFVGAGEVGKHNSSGKSLKINKKLYKFVIDGEEINANNLKCTAAQSALTRIISTSLRHGTNIKYIVNQLNKSEGNILSFSKVIARTLKKYIADGEKIAGVTCEECDSKDIIFQEGCLTCQNCGNSKCG